MTCFKLCNTEGYPYFVEFDLWLYQIASVSFLHCNLNVIIPYEVPFFLLVSAQYKHARAYQPMDFLDHLITSWQRSIPPPPPARSLEPDRGRGRQRAFRQKLRHFATRPRWWPAAAAACLAVWLAHGVSPGARPRATAEDPRAPADKRAASSLIGRSTTMAGPARSFQHENR